MPDLAPVRHRRRTKSILDRVAAWERRHPRAARAAVLVTAVLAAWACEYATGGSIWAALCRLRLMLAGRLGELLAAAPPATP